MKSYKASPARGVTDAFRFRIGISLVENPTLYNVTWPLPKPSLVIKVHAPSLKNSVILRPTAREVILRPSKARQTCVGRDDLGKSSPFVPGDLLFCCYCSFFIIIKKKKKKKKKARKKEKGRHANFDTGERRIDSKKFTGIFSRVLSIPQFRC